MSGVFNSSVKGYNGNLNYLDVVYCLEENREKIAEDSTKLQ